MKSCVGLIVSGLILVAAMSVGATQVSPGGLVIEGQMYVTGDPDWDPVLGEYVPSDGWYDFFVPSEVWNWYDHPNPDPQDLMYHGDNEIGVREGVTDIPLGIYEAGSLAWLGHAVHAFDLTVRAATPAGWSGSLNLLLELRSSSPGVDEVYWSLLGPFSSEPVHAYIELPGPSPGYEVRLIAVPDVSPFISLLSGIGLLVYRQRRNRS